MEDRGHDEILETASGASRPQDAGTTQEMQSATLETEMVMELDLAETERKMAMEAVLAVRSHRNFNVTWWAKQVPKLLGYVDHLRKNMTAAVSLDG